MLLTDYEETLSSKIVWTQLVAQKYKIRMPTQ